MIPVLPTVLIVEDDPLEQAMLAEIIAQDGICAVQRVSSGEEALRLLPVIKPDIVLLDIEMVGMDGYAVCRRIRSCDAYRFIKILMVSGHGQVDERRRGYEAGADDYITKPFDVQEFLAKVRVYTRLKYQEEVDQVKGDLLTLLTHETMTPINGILGCGEILLADAGLGPAHRELVTMIDAAGRQLNRFLQNAILLSKLKAGLALTMSARPVLALVEHVVAECALRYKEKDLEVVVSGDHHLRCVADWPLVSYALDAIVGNAMKFSPPGGLVTVAVGAENQCCQILVDDQGCGVERDRKTRIFEEFSIFDVAHHQQGQGLGMAISHRICRCHGGDVAVVDNPAGCGSRFMVSIPLVEGG